MDATVKAIGFREFSRDMRRLDPAFAREARREYQSLGQPVLESAQGLAPRQTGAFARTLKLSVTQRGIAIVSSHPGAGVLHWGGTIRPRGVPITFPRTLFAVRAAEAHMNRLVEGLGDAIERAADSTGWH